MVWRWRDLAAGAALGVLTLATVLVAYWLYVRSTLPDCGFCDDAASSVSEAPG